MPGRIVSYIHSDAITANKGGSLVKVECITDFAANTKEFVEFSNLCAKMIYASSSIAWDDVVLSFPELEDKRRDLEVILKEKIQVSEIAVLKL